MGYMTHHQIWKALEQGDPDHFGGEHAPFICQTYFIRGQHKSAWQIPFPTNRRPLLAYVEHVLQGNSGVSLKTRKIVYNEPRTWIWQAFLIASLTLPPANMEVHKPPVERLLSSWKGPFCTSMSVGGRVPGDLFQFLEDSCSKKRIERAGRSSPGLNRGPGKNSELMSPQARRPSPFAIARPLSL